MVILVGKIIVVFENTQRLISKHLIFLNRMTTIFAILSCLFLYISKLSSMHCTHTSHLCVTPYLGKNVRLCLFF